MGNIIVLDELTINKIAAGEVIERPASVIKEMAENSIDAGATQITVEIRRGGITYIRVTDNGSGIPYDDVLLAFEKHATSKIKCGDDLDSIGTLGFRGEALSSICAVSKVEVTTKIKNENYGVKVIMQGGTLVENTSCGCPDGTTFVVKDLFFNTPARYKFLKKDATEAGHVIDLIERMALAHPEISFKLINNASEVLRTRGDGVLKNVVYSIYGKDVTDSVKSIDFKDKGIEITGFAGDISSAASSRGRQSLFINGRYVRSKVVYSAVDEAYKTFMMKGKYPFIILNVKISPQHVDVNVHPTKMEVRFSDDGAVYRWIYNAVKAALYDKSMKFGNEDRSRGIGTNYMPDLYKTPFDVKTRSEVREDRAEYIKNEQKIPVVQELPAQHVKQESPAQQERTEPRQPEHVQRTELNRMELTQRTELNRTEHAQRTEPNQTELTQRTELNQTESAHMSGPDGAKPARPSEPLKQSEQPDIIRHQAQPAQNILTDALYIGQIFNTYIILQRSGEILFIDQHAAHERIMYEKIKEQYKSTQRSIQPLLVPEVIELSAGEFTIYKNNIDYVNELGFVAEEFGENSLIIREIPSFVDVSTAKQVVLEILGDIMENNIKITENKADISDDVLKIMACKGAVKAKNKLDESEVKALLDDMVKLNCPLACPHGRPIIIHMAKSELEKKFKRIV